MLGAEYESGNQKCSPVAFSLVAAATYVALARAGWAETEASANMTMTLTVPPVAPQLRSICDKIHFHVTNSSPLGTTCKIPLLSAVGYSYMRDLQVNTRYLYYN